MRRDSTSQTPHEGSLRRPTLRCLDIVGAIPFRVRIMSSDAGGGRRLNRDSATEPLSTVRLCDSAIYIYLANAFGVDMSVPAVHYYYRRPI